MKRLFNRILEELRFRFKVKDVLWYRKIKWYGIPFSDVAWNKQLKCPSIISLGVHLNEENLIFILESYDLLQSLRSRLEIELIQVDRKVILQYDDLKIWVESRQEILIFSEVFLSTTYNMKFDRPTLVMDVGFNIGISSLFFARNEKVEKILAFEPLQPTIAKGKEILLLNAHLAQKIELFEYGLSKKDGKHLVAYDYEKKGNVGIGSSKVLEANSSKEHLIVKDSFEVLNQIIAENSAYEIFVKIDCEGSEYDILKRWDETSMIKKITSMAIEYHFKGSSVIVEMLNRNSFSTVVLNERNDIGMIYAWNKG